MEIFVVLFLYFFWTISFIIRLIKILLCLYHTFVACIYYCSEKLVSIKFVILFKTNHVFGGQLRRAVVEFIGNEQRN